MTTVHRLSRQDARRIAIRAQLLAAPPPTDLLDVVRHLGLVQNDPTAAVAPSAELVAWSRLGPAYRYGDLAAATADGSLIELFGMLRPAEDIGLYRAQMAGWPGTGRHPELEVAQQEWVDANDDCRRAILERLEDEGPLPSRDLPDITVVPWRSSGWNTNRNVRMLLELMVARGEVAAAGYRGRDRLWDLAERVYPDGPVIPLEEAEAIRARRRLHALGIARVRTTRTMVEPNDVGGIGEPAEIDGLRGKWRVDPQYLDRTFRGRTALLSPLDRLIFDRTRMVEIFEFDYQLEMYKPAAKRRWGYWAMPILHHDRLVGALDATADRAAGVFRVHAVHRTEPLTAAAEKAVQREIRALAAWLQLDLVTDE
ncbi:MAG TPA: crosslink repair DNA glycosylase YcaQ family protein [Nakamurella sp.]|nr:crosslink repair DNA glycosylase YcaQ family protein [Nakamurella sp.]